MKITKISDERRLFIEFVFCERSISLCFCKKTKYDTGLLKILKKDGITLKKLEKLFIKDVKNKAFAKYEDSYQYSDTIERIFKETEKYTIYFRVLCRNIYYILVWSGEDGKYIKKFISL